MIVLWVCFLSKGRSSCSVGVVWASLYSDSIVYCKPVVCSVTFSSSAFSFTASTQVSCWLGRLRSLCEPDCHFMQPYCITCWWTIALSSLLWHRSWMLNSFITDFLGYWCRTEKRKRLGEKQCGFASCAEYILTALFLSRVQLSKEYLNKVSKQNHGLSQDPGSLKQSTTPFQSTRLYFLPVENRLQNKD